MANSSLANKYRPSDFSQVYGQGVVVDIVRKMCDSKDLSNRNFLFTGPAGTGKAQPLYSKVLTPNGFITMGEVTVGQEIITGSGAVAKVSGVFPQGVRPIFAIKLSDGGEILVADNHLNLVRVDTQETVITTDCLLTCFAGGHTLDIPKADLSKWEFDVPNYSEYREITDVVYIGKEECQCIYVDHPDHTYISDGFIPTHNTTLSRIIAKSLNGNLDNIVEVDAASHSGVDDVRELVQQASQYPIGTKYKIIICDECFPSNTLISTPTGHKNISELVAGDFIYSMSGVNRVTHIFKSSVLTTRLCCVTINSNQIITTVDHLFFTNTGWVPAIELSSGDVVYGAEDLSELWKTVSESTQDSKILLSSLLSGVSKDAPCTEDENCCLSSMWKVFSDTELLISKNLFETLPEDSHFEVKYNNLQFRIRHGITETIIRKDDSKQSDEIGRNYTEDDTDQTSKWNITPVDCNTGWQREVYNTTDSLMGCIRRWMGIGVSNSNILQSKSFGVSYLLQSRPWLLTDETCCRGGWQKPQFEKAVIKGLKERGISSGKRVDCVEVYQPGNNDELFRGSFSDTELSQDYVTMYDLEVENDHSYFASDILVHNCHSFSNTAWQSLLKCLEDQVGSTIWIFATTNPEKIPATIISRVQTFKLSKISTSNIQKRLKFIVDSEIKEGHEFTYTDDALSYIARLSNGGMRDAITSLDKCLAFDNAVTTELVEKALDLPSYDDYFGLLNGLVRKDNAEITKIVDQVYNSGTNFIKWFEGFHSFLCNIVKYVFLKDIAKTMIPPHYADKLAKYNEQHAFICLKLSNVVMAMNKDLKLTQYQLETAMTYLCVPVAPKKEN